MSGRQVVRKRFTSIRRARSVRIATAVAVIAASLAGAGAPSRAAAGDTPYTFAHEQFDAALFPPTNWSTPDGAWTQTCPATPANALPFVVGCSAVATMTSTAVGGFAQLEFNPPTGVPADLQNPTLTFYSDFTPDPTSIGDHLLVAQSQTQGSIGGDLTIVDPSIETRAHGSQVLVTLPLTSTKLPLLFRWTNFGYDTATVSPHATWAISDVTISGTVAGTPYSLTADPIPNTANPSLKAGTPRTLALSGSSTPTGDSLGFAITTPPTVGTLGPITAVDATHSHVTYTTALNACPDPTGIANLICVDTFDYKATDLGGKTSSPAQVVLDVHPGGAGSQTVTVDAPTAVSYSTLNRAGTPTQGADLSGAIAVGPDAFPDAVEVKVADLDGTIDLPDLAGSGVTLLDGTTSGQSQIHFSGSVRQIGLALGQVRFFPTTGTGTPTTSLTVFTADLGATGQGPQVQGAGATITISTAPPPPPRPVISLPTGPLSVATGQGPLTFPAGAATGISIADGGASATTDDTVLLSVDSGTLALPAGETGITQTGSHGTLDLTGTVGDLNAALTDLTFDPTGVGIPTVTLTAQVQDPDSTLASTQKSAPITVTQSPFAFGTATVGTLANVPVTLFLCGQGPAGDALSFTITGQPAHGTLVADPSASAATSGCSQTNTGVLISGYTYTPTAGYVGPDSLSYTVDDATTHLKSAINTIGVTVGAHAKPTAYDKTASTSEDTPVDVTLCGLNPDPQPALAFGILTGPQSGTLTDDGVPSVNSCSGANQVPRTFTYTPAPGSFTSDGADSFTYLVNNGVQSDPATVAITVATRTPQVSSENVAVDENSSIGLLLCTTEPGGNLTFSIDGPAHGTLDTAGAPTVGPDCPSGTFIQRERYVPNRLFSGSDSFTYTAHAGTYTSAPATVAITVNHVEVPPTAAAQQVTDFAPHPVAITLAGASEQGSPLTYRVIIQPTLGTLSGTAPNLTYTPTAGSGQDTFTFVTNDGVADSPPATVAVAVITPHLDATVCIPGVPVGTDHYGCASTLPFAPDGSGGQIPLAHTSGARNDELQLQVTVTNSTAVADTVTIKAPTATPPWSLRYAVAGQDVTDTITTTGVVVTLAPASSAWVQVLAFAPASFPAPPTVSLAVGATSGNDPSVSARRSIEIQDGTSSPLLTLAQRDGSGSVAPPGALSVVPAMVGGGVAGGALIEGGLTGTGDNLVTLKAEPQAGSTAAIAVQYLLGSTDVTTRVLAGTETVQCYVDGGCPPIKAVLTPTGGEGRLDVAITETSLIDGQSSTSLLFATAGSTSGPDLSTDLPNLGQGVFEPTPVTQITSTPVEASGSASRALFLLNTGDVSDTVTVRVATDNAADPASVIAVTGFPAGTVDQGGGVYAVPMRATEDDRLTVTDTAGPTAGFAPSSVTVTATSGLDSTKLDSSKIAFPTYSYAPRLNASLTALVIDGTPVSQDLLLTEQNVGLPPQGDTVVIAAPPTDANIALAYTLTTPPGLPGAGTANVTAAVTGGGFTTTLVPNGAPAETLTVTADGTAAGVPGTVRSVPVTVTSASSLPVGRTATVTLTVQFRGAPPTVTVATPLTGKTVNVGDTSPATFACVSRSLVSCAATVTAESGAVVGQLKSGDSLPAAAGGRYTLTATARDQFGRSATATAGYVVIAPPTATITTPADRTQLAKGSSASASFVCASPSSTIAACSGTVTSPDGVAIPLPSGHTVPTALSGTYMITVTAIDATGLTTTTVSTYVVPGVAAACTQKVDIGVVEVTTGGCFTKEGTAALPVYKTTSATMLNGLALPPAPSGLFFRISKLSADNSVQLSVSTATIKLGSFIAFHGAISWTVPASGSANGSKLTVVTLAGDTMFRGLKLGGGVALTFGIDATGAHYSSFGLAIELPNVFKAAAGSDAGGVVANASVLVDAGGVAHYDGLLLMATNVYVGSLHVNSVCFSYVPAGSSGAISPCPLPASGGAPFVECGGTPNSDRWDGNAVLSLPTKSNTQLTFYGGVANNSLASLGGSVSSLGQSVPLVEGVFLDHVSVGLCIDPPPFQIKGNVGVTVLPTAKSTLNPKGDVVDVDGTFQYTDTYGTRAWVLDLSGSVAILGKQIGSGRLLLSPTGLIQFRADLNLSFADNLVRVNGTIYGWLDTPVRTFNINGGVTGCIGPICGSISLVASNIGAAGCASLGSIPIYTLVEDSDFVWYEPWKVHWVASNIDLEAGFGTDWNGSNVRVFAASCDLGDYTAHAASSAVGQTQPLAFTVPAGAPALSVKVSGHGAPPSIVVHGPSGETITSPSAPQRSAQSAGHWVLIENPTDDSTSVLLIKPPAGKWTVTPGPGAVAPTALQTAPFTAPPALVATVVRRGARDTVGLGYALPPGATLSLVEHGRGVERTLVSQIVGHACPGPNRPGGQQLRCAQQTFIPTPGPGGKREIVAIVRTAAGLPLKTQVIATFTAPAQPHPSRPARLRIRRTPGGTLVYWRASVPAKFQTIAVHLGSGARFGVSATNCSTIRLTGIPVGESVGIAVAGVRATDMTTGPFARAHLAGGRARTAFARGRPPHACVVHGPTSAG